MSVPMDVHGFNLQFVLGYQGFHSLNRVTLDTPSP